MVEKFFLDTDSWACTIHNTIVSNLNPSLFFIQVCNYIKFALSVCISFHFVFLVFRITSMSSVS